MAVTIRSAPIPELKWRHFHHLRSASLGTGLEHRVMSGHPLRWPKYYFNDSHVLEKIIMWVFQYLLFNPPLQEV